MCVQSNDNRRLETVQSYCAQYTFKKKKTALRNNDCKIHGMVTINISAVQ